MSRKITLIILGALIVISCVLHIWKKNKIDLMIDRLEILTAKKRELTLQNREIEIAIENLSRSERIKKIATEELGMYTPDPETLTVKLDENL
jgi:cell division protein FtsL